MFTKDQLQKMNSDELIKIFTLKSVAIRSLNDLGFSRSEIAKMLNIRYQHVRNTLVQELKKKVEDIHTSDDDDQMNLFNSK